MRRTATAGIAAAAIVLASALAASPALAAPTAATPPTISGSAVYGTTLTCRNGTWSAGAGSFTYQWQLADGNVAIGTGPTLKVRAIWLKLGVVCAVTAKDSTGASSVATSPPVTPRAASAKIKLTRATVSKARTVRISGTISPTASLAGGAGSLVLYRQSSFGLVQLSFNGRQTHPPANGRFTLTSAHEPTGNNTYVIQYVPSSPGFVGQVLASRKLRVR